VAAPPRLVLDRALTNTMIGAAADPEAVVRASALRALAASPELQSPRVVAAVTARLIDRSRIVRAQAAEILLALGTVQLPGAAGAALARALDDHAQALAGFPDSAANITELAWRQLERGQAADAEVLVARALALDGRRARPWVIRGVLEARRERMAEAASAWRKAREIDPGYPNIDKLIEEATRRVPR
jgi:tetratricopeptide (TPR) repeat protein